MQTKNLKSKQYTFFFFKLQNVKHSKIIQIMYNCKQYTLISKIAYEGRP